MSTPAINGQHTSTHKTRRGLTRLLWICIALTALTVGVDLTLRFAFGLGNPVMSQADAAASYILKPNQSVYRFGGHHVSINSYGMRADPVPGAKPPGTLRIFFIGDSVTYGSTHVGQNDIFSEIVHHSLPAILHRPVQVLNGSASAWAIGNELGYLRSRGTFGSDVVLLVLNTGDITETPATMQEVGDELVSGKPWCALDEVYTRVVKARLLHLIRAQDKGDDAGTNSASAIANNLAYLNQFAAFVRQHHARMGVIFIPFRKFISTGAASSAPASLVTWSRQQKVPLLDTTSALSGEPVNAVSYDGYHLTAKGNNLVATDIDRHWQQIAK